MRKLAIIAIMLILISASIAVAITESDLTGRPAGTRVQFRNSAGVMVSYVSTGSGWTASGYPLLNSGQLATQLSSSSVQPTFTPPSATSPAPATTNINLNPQYEVVPTGIIGVTENGVQVVRNADGSISYYRDVYNYQNDLPIAGDALNMYRANNPAVVEKYEPQAAPAPTTPAEETAPQQVTEAGEGPGGGAAGTTGTPTPAGTTGAQQEPISKIEISIRSELAAAQQELADAQSARDSARAGEHVQAAEAVTAAEARVTAAENAARDAGIDVGEATVADEAQPPAAGAAGPSGAPGAPQEPVRIGGYMNTPYGEVTVKQDLATGETLYFKTDGTRITDDGIIADLESNYQQSGTFAMDLGNFVQYYRVYSGLQGYSSLIFDKEFLANWRNRVNEIFCNKVLGYLPLSRDCWTSTVCGVYTEITPPQDGVLFTAPVGGLPAVAAHMEGERSLPIVTPSQTSWVYKVTFSVTNPLDETLKINVYFQSAEKKAAWWPADQEVGEGNTFAAVGASALMKLSSTDYTAVCLSFSPSLESFGGRRTGSICNSITQYAGAATAPYSVATGTETAAQPGATTPAAPTTPGANI